jgi:glycosyltransferase involved in cell wall biosynthesis
MNVLQLSKFFPPVHGGIESVAWELAEGLHAAGLGHAVLCANRGLRTVHERVSHGYDVTRAGSWGTVLSTSIAPALLLQLRRMARACDVLHVHMPDPAAALAIWWVRPRARLVLHWHSDVIRQQRALHLYAPLQRWLLQRADAIVATSEPYAHASDALRPWLDKVQVIPIGISDNCAAARPDRVAALRQQVRGRHVVFALGRMTYYKGFDILIQAAAQLPEDVVVLVGGGGELLESYKHQAAQAGLAGKVQFLGHVPDEDLPDHFAACDVFCMPSTVRAEAYGVAMLEAMVMARPIVASDIPGSAVPWVNVHERTGFNVAVADPGALAQALTALCRDPGLRQTMGQASRARYLNEFTAGLMTQRTIQLYQRLCGRA